MIKKILSRIKRIHSSLREVSKSKNRSSKWDSVRDHHLRQHQICESCGNNEHLQVHHIEPFHLHPELELDPNNLITLCMGKNSCHLDIGHGGSFRAYNPDVLDDAEKFRIILKDNILKDKHSLIKEIKLKRKLV